MRLLTETNNDKKKMYIELFLTAKRLSSLIHVYGRRTVDYQVYFNMGRQWFHLVIAEQREGAERKRGVWVLRKTFCFMYSA